MPHGEGQRHAAVAQFQAFDVAEIEIPVPVMKVAVAHATAGHPPHYLRAGGCAVGLVARLQRLAERDALPGVHGGLPADCASLSLSLVSPARSGAAPGPRTT